MGKFITFEGGEGSGKSSVIKDVRKWLLDKGYSVLTTKDPGGSVIGDQIRKILLTDDNRDMANETELLLYLASRAELVDKVIRPNLDHFDFVLCDRFFDSTTVYQGKIREWDDVQINHVPILDILHKIFSSNIIPDQTFILDVDPKVGLSRSLGDAKDEGKWEGKGLEIHRRINNAFYLMVMNDITGRFIYINANKSLDHMAGTIMFYFKHHILKGGKDA